MNSQPTTESKALIWRNILIVFLVAVIVALASKQCQPPVAVTGDPGINTPKQYTDAAGTVHTEVRPAQGAGYSSLERKYQVTIDSLRKALQVSRSDIKSHTEAAIDIAGTFKPEIKKPDTIIENTGCPADLAAISFEDPYFSLQGNMHPDSTWRYQVRDTLKTTTYTRKGVMYMDATMQNPNAVVSGLKGIRIEPMVKKWAIGITAGYVYDGQRWKPGISVGVTKTLFRW